MQQTLQQFRDRLQQEWPVAVRDAVNTEGDVDCSRAIVKWPGNNEVTYDVPREEIYAVMRGN